MELTPLTAVSPIDGRYRKQVSHLDEFFSEYALIKYRVLVEVEYFFFLADQKFFKLSPKAKTAFTGMCLKHMVKVVLILLKYSYDIALYHLVLIVLCEFNYRTRLFVVNTVSYFCTTDDFIIDTCSLRRLRIVGLFPLHDHCMVFTSFSSFLP